MRRKMEVGRDGEDMKNERGKEKWTEDSTFIAMEPYTEHMQTEH